ncbi:MAG: AAA domain-containing protein [Gordonia sp. (in: high G+C Gram-positive bacteria)]
MTEEHGRDGRREQVFGLLGFLRDLLHLRTTVIREVDEHPARLAVGPGSRIPIITAAQGGEELLTCRPGDPGFDDLSAILDQLATAPEAYELVAAGGLVTIGRADASDTDPPLIHEHLLTQAAVAARDAETGIISVRLGGGSVPVLADTPLLAGIDGIDLERVTRIRARAATLANPLHPKAAELVGSWASRLRPDSNTVTVHVDPAPELVLRHRSTLPLLEFYDAIIAHLRASDAPVPIGLAQLVEPIGTEERIAALADAGALAAADLVADAVYPLPSNVEQRDVFARLGADSGVVVEGPPGTGKTQTIANVVAALLAKGQRVLVTSEKANALTVLRDLLPPELAELMVSTADISTDRYTAIVSGVEAITGRKATDTDSVARAEIDDLAARRQQAVERRERALAGLWELRRAETEVHEWIAGDYRGTAAAIVRQTNADAARLGWIPGPLSGPRPPLDDEEFTRLLSLLRATGGRADRLTQRFVDFDQALPDPGTLDRICLRIERRPSQAMVGNGSLIAVLAHVNAERLGRIQEICDRLGRTAAEVTTFPTMMVDAANRLLAGQGGYLWSRVTAVAPAIAEAVAGDRAAGLHTVTVSGARPGDSELFAAAARYLADGGRWRGRLRRSPEQRAVEESGIEATVDGRRPTDARTLQAVADHLAVFDAIHQVQRALAELHVPVDTSGTRSAQLDRLVRLDSQIRTVTALVTQRNRLVAELESISPGGPRPRTVAGAAAVAAEAGAIAAVNDATLAERQLTDLTDALARELERGPSPEGDALVAALRSADINAIRAARRAAVAARAQWQDQTAVDLLLLRLKAKAPEFAELLSATADDRVWDERLRQVGRAWQWWRARDWAAARSDPRAEQRWLASLDEAEADIAQLSTALVAARAWHACEARLTVDQVQALQSYRDHMINLGKGSGKFAGRFRAAAREAMNHAAGAVPAWVMPLAQVAEMVPPEPNSFDVVIIEEGSQSDITAVFLLWLAPRVIIVGDDKQCAPNGMSGTSLDETFAALDAHLSDLPHYLRDGLTPRSSLFSLLRSRFGHLIRLREHFRSMPEIIGFSSAQFYPDAPLVPVRQYGSDRLDPLRTVFVDGDANGSGGRLANEAEAQAIVTTLVGLLADNAYDGMDFGIVTLQGTRQAEVIARLLAEQIDDETRRSRRIRVGAPPDFQGDERNVMMLSMVVSDAAAIAPLTRAESQRRINVAASRAMDQMWLFHSVALDDLAPGDLRRSLLGYLEANAGPAISPMPVDVPDDRRVEPFASLFEQRVFNRLAARGYHVTPKVVVNNRTIDLVVTGADGRMAVECDGDEFTSTGAQARSDVERERELRRCGWEFWRVRESEFELDADESLSGLWDALERRGVKPGSALAGTTPERRPWEPIDLR